MARTVLLADDSVTAQNMGRRILMDAGYEVITVNNGSAALKKIHEHRPDLIVLDVYMPGYGGLEVCQRLKESADTARIPVLLSVGKMEPFKADEAKRVRADGHIVKPFEASELLAALTKLEDRIVPADSRDGRSGKSEKKGRTWQTEDTVVGADDARTERVAHLSEAKKRNASGSADEAADQNKPTAAPAASAEPSAAVGTATTEAQAPKVSAEVSTEVETSAVQAENSQELLLGKSLFGKPVHGEIALGDSIFDKTIFGKSASGKSLPGESGSVSAETNPAAAAVALAASEVPRWVAESMPLTAEESSLDLDELMQRSRAISVAVAAASEAAPHEQVTSSNAVAEQIAPEAVAELEIANRSEAAFAAAASAGASASAASDALGLSCQHSAFGFQPASDQPASLQPTNTGSVAAPETAVSAPEAEPTGSYEAAAAWENWQQIRDSVMSPKKAEALAESVAEMATVTAHATSQSLGHASAETPTSTESPASQDPTPSVIAAAAAEEASSINDIVDSVLADLKPRLMQEIAKKLAAKK